MFAAPRVERFEALSSWIGRLALSQGTTLRDLSRHFGLDYQGDIDLLSSPEQQDHVLRACGLEQDELDIPRRVFENLRRVASDGGQFMATIKGRPRYRFCAECLRDQPNPFFPLHWRFVAWRACPDHDCLLEDQCPHCGAAITLPFNLLGAGPQHKGVATLSTIPPSERSAAPRLMPDFKINFASETYSNGTPTRWMACCSDGQPRAARSSLSLAVNALLQTNTTCCSSRSPGSVANEAFPVLCDFHRAISQARSFS